MFHTETPPLHCFSTYTITLILPGSLSQTLSHTHRHKAHSSARCSPYLPPYVPLVLLIKACPFKCRPVCPFRLWCRLPPSWAHLNPSFHPFFSPPRPIALLLLRVFPLLLLFSAWHIVFFALQGDYTAHAILNPYLGPPLIFVNKAVHVRLKTIKSIKPLLLLLSLLYWLYPLFYGVAELLSLWSCVSFMLCLSLSHSPPEVISRVYGWEVQSRRAFMSLSPGIRVSCSGEK